MLPWHAQNSEVITLFQFGWEQTKIFHDIKFWVTKNIKWDGTLMLPALIWFRAGTVWFCYNIAFSKILASCWNPIAHMWWWAMGYFGEFRANDDQCYLCNCLVWNIMQFLTWNKIPPYHAITGPGITEPYSTCILCKIHREDTIFWNGTIHKM